MNVWILERLPRRSKEEEEEVEDAEEEEKRGPAIFWQGLVSKRGALLFVSVLSQPRTPSDGFMMVVVVDTVKAKT